MATAAELKARLLKHAAKQLPTVAKELAVSRVADHADSNAAGASGSAGPLPGVEGIPSGVGGSNELLVREAALLVAEPRKEQLDEQQQSTKVIPRTGSDDRGASSGTVPDVLEQPPASSAVSAPVEVRTDLQPTTLVVVERPAESGSARDNNGQSEEDGNGTDDEPATDLDITNPVHQEFLQRLNDVEAALLARDPLMKTHLGAIHKAMLQYEEIANLLRPHEIAKIMSAQQAHTGIVLRAETVGKTKAAASKKAAQLGLNDV